MRPKKSILSAPTKVHLSRGGGGGGVVPKFENTKAPTKVHRSRGGRGGGVVPKFENTKIPLNGIIFRGRYIYSYRNIFDLFLFLFFVVKSSKNDKKLFAFSWGGGTFSTEHFYVGFGQLLEFARWTFPPIKKNKKIKK